MMPNKAGIVPASKVPNEKVVEYQPGDILLSNIRPYFKKIWYADKNGGCSSDVLCIRAKEGTDSTFLYYLLSQDSFFDYVMSGAKGSKMPRGDKSQIMKWEVEVPDLNEQKRIGIILKTIDDKIAINNHINHNLEEQARNHFEAWCNQCKESKTIAELSFNVLDYTQNPHNKVVLLNSSDVTEGVFASLPFVENKDLKGQFKKRFCKGDILYSEIRPRNHHYALCYFNAEKYVASTRLMVIRRNPSLLRSDVLLYQYLLRPQVEGEFTSKTESRSGTFPQGNYEDLSSSVVPYNCDNDIISKTLDSLYSRIWNNIEENKRLSQIRDSLLPKLMNDNLNTTI
ncbi:MAG: restriction endonuclease subunit S [Bacteroidaceae bacterium]|nr:restriction endonuclease subunit S [Bacteroidaceae bacterium]